ncbi:unnamed protein product [Ceratitis capitata]|uniref:(Mediterranean fruit fly) hypothetical protein n=1 Tax=Ceratitis capitata TaxID=7213 RepID=A0A811UAE4_CERCA|nr:unnamed protein product [Ceratitis capitata]
MVVAVSYFVTLVFGKMKIVSGNIIINRHCDKSLEPSANVCADTCVQPSLFQFAQNIMVLGAHSQIVANWALTFVALAKNNEEKLRHLFLEFRPKAVPLAILELS